MRDNTNHADLIFEDGQYFLTGHVDFYNVKELLLKSLRSIGSSQSFTINFSRLSAGNSAVVGLMVEWQKLAKKNHTKVIFTNLPDKIVSILNAAGMKELVLTKTQHPAPHLHP